MAEVVANLLGERILERDDFRLIVSKFENASAKQFLTKRASSDLTDTDILTALRFADILSQSTDESHRGWAYFLIAAIQELKELGQLGDFGSDQLNNFSVAVFSELGNFPGINKIEQEMGEQASAIPAERRFSRAIKEEFQATSDRSGVFTDPQYKIRTRMRDVDYYSFSGPTSLGKSFIIKDFVKAAVQKPGMSGSAVVFLVPTNALVAQTASDLRSITSEIQSVNVAIYPTQPRYLVERFSTTIFVFTPERLIRFLNAPSQSIKILIVDEAHKVVAQNDTRAPLYYYAIDRAVRSHATKLFFSSPSISNPDLLLKLFGTRGGSLVINERVVAQQRFLIDFVEETASYYSNLPSLDRVLLSPSTIKHHDFKAAIEYWASRTKSLVYLNTPSKVVKAALEFAQGRNAVSSSRINKLIAKIKEEIHPEYFLIDVLRKGLAFHHGKMPVSIREEIESAFKDRDSGIDLLVCTSTLLEGVNLPAKNLFILTDRQGDGSKPLGKIDFENLAGRAGRLAQDYSGNVVCVRIKDTNWEAPASQIPNQGPSRADSFIVDPESAEKWRYTDLERILNGQALPKKRNLTQREIAEKYATVMLIQAQNSQPSLLFQNFNKKVKNGGHKIENVVKELGIDSRVIEESPEISPRVQDRAFGGLPRQDTDAVILQTSSELDANSIYSLLQQIRKLYDWDQRETHKLSNLVPHPRFGEDTISKRLWYWSILVEQWISGTPVNVMIAKSIRYYASKGTIKIPDYEGSGRIYQAQTFDPSSKVHINFVIETLLADLENGVRFRLASYFKSYHNLCVSKYGNDNAGIDLSVLIEYGTTDLSSIELQQIGFSREGANELLLKGSSHVSSTENGSIEEIDFAAILDNEVLTMALKEEARKLFIA